MSRFLRRNRSEVALGAAPLVLATAFAAIGMAGSIGNNTNPPRDARHTLGLLKEAIAARPSGRRRRVEVLPVSTSTQP